MSAKLDPDDGAGAGASFDVPGCVFLSKLDPDDDSEEKLDELNTEEKTNTEELEMVAGKSFSGVPPDSTANVAGSCDPVLHCFTLNVRRRLAAARSVDARAVVYERMMSEGMGEVKRLVSAHTLDHPSATHTAARRFACNDELDLTVLRKKVDALAVELDITVPVHNNMLKECLTHGTADIVFAISGMFDGAK